LQGLAHQSDGVLGPIEANGGLGHEIKRHGVPIGFRQPGEHLGGFLESAGIFQDGGQLPRGRTILGMGGQELFQGLDGLGNHAPHLVGVGQVKGQLTGIGKAGQGFFQGGRSLVALVLAPLEIGQFHGQIRRGVEGGQFFQGGHGFALAVLAQQVLIDEKEVIGLRRGGESFFELHLARRGAGGAGVGQQAGQQRQHEKKRQARREKTIRGVRHGRHPMRRALSQRVSLRGSGGTTPP